MPPGDPGWLHSPVPPPAGTSPTVPTQGPPPTEPTQPLGPQGPYVAPQRSVSRSGGEEHPTDPHLSAASTPPSPPPGGGEGWWNLFESAAEPPPPPPKPRRRLLLISGSVLAVVALCLIGVVVLIGSRHSDAPQSDGPGRAEQTTTETPKPDSKLLSMVPPGIDGNGCAPDTTGSTQPSIVCKGSGTAGDPSRLTLTGAGDKAGLDAAFNQVVNRTKVVLCPGNIQSPGPWRRSAAPQVSAGTLMCGWQDKTPVVAWTDESRLLVVVAEGAPGVDALTALYRWWTTHS